MRALRFSPRGRRRGVHLVEAAIVLTVFIPFLFGLFQYGHMQMISSLLVTACQNAARYGSTEGVSTADVEQRVKKTLGGAISPARLDQGVVQILVKDASVFDTGGDHYDDPAAYKSDPGWFEALPDVELSDAEPRSLFLVRAVVAYNDIAILKLPFMDGAVLVGQSICRHE